MPSPGAWSGYAACDVVAAGGQEQSAIPAAHLEGAGVLGLPDVIDDQQQTAVAEQGGESAAGLLRRAGLFECLSR